MACGEAETVGAGGGSGAADDTSSEALDDTAAGGDEDCETDFVLTWNAVGEPFFHTWCRSCHSADAPQRFGAPEGVDFDTEEQVRSQAAKIRTWTIDMEAMPLGGGLSEDDILLLDLYLRCGL